MNQKIEKKEYVAPQMSVVEMTFGPVLLVESSMDSSDNGFGVDDLGETSNFD